MPGGVEPDRHRAADRPTNELEIDLRVTSDERLTVVCAVFFRKCLVDIAITRGDEAPEGDRTPARGHAGRGSRRLDADEGDVAAPVVGVGEVDAAGALGRR